jgi:hypothetical protein
MIAARKSWEEARGVEEGFVVRECRRGCEGVGINSGEIERVKLVKMRGRGYEKGEREGGVMPVEMRL